MFIYQGWMDIECFFVKGNGGMLRLFCMQKLGAKGSVHYSRLFAISVFVIAAFYCTFLESTQYSPKTTKEHVALSR